MLPSTRGGRVELVLSLGVLALGIFATVVAFRLPEAGGYARIGPNFMPKVVSGGLIVLGFWLLAEVFTGGWRERVHDDPAERGEHAFHLGAFAWVSAALFAQMALIHNGGFAIAAMVLYALVARLRQRPLGARPGDRPGARRGGVSLLRALPQRQSARRLAAAAAGNGWAMSAHGRSEALILPRAARRAV
jgi:putative tricarboxylic transport membrane protein